MREFPEDALRRVEVRLPGAPESPAQARRMVRETLDEWQLAGLVDTAALLVSELVTNAVLHARTDIELRVEQSHDVLRITVCDRSPLLPVRRRHGLGAGTGRGLGLVEELSAQWGAVSELDGWSKAVWFVLPTDPAELPDSPEGALFGTHWAAMLEEL